MKKLFFSFTLLLITAGAYAQRNVNFVSFFPPSHIIHKNVTLTQNANSFNRDDATGATSGETDYLKKTGGLVLGAAPNSQIRVENLKIETTTGYAIPNFYADNNLKIVSSTGAIKTLTIGSGARDTTDISATNYGMNFGTYSGVKPTVYVGNLTTLENGKTINGFPPALGSNDKLKWVNLRIKGSEECRPYLVKYTGSAPINNCDEPQDEDWP